MTYPTSLDALRTDLTGTDRADEVGHAELHNLVDAAVMAVQAELGLDPSGAYATVAARLAAIDALGPLPATALYARAPSGAPLFSIGPVLASSIYQMGEASMSFLPHFLYGGETLESVGIKTTIAASAGGVARLGLYASTAQGLPGALVADWGTVDTTVGAGVIEKTISTSVPSTGLYWAAIAAQGAPATRATFASCSKSLIQVNRGSFDLAASLNNPTMSYLPFQQSPGVSGALPATATPSGGLYAPLVGLKRTAP